MNPWLALFQPSLLAKKWLRKEDGWSLKTKLELDWFPYPHYAYGLNQATIQAGRLGIDAISAIVFGIGDGEGLLAMENIVAAISKESGVAIHTYGFDVGEGVPRSTDPRDLPYLKRDGASTFDRAAVDKKLTRSTLIVGDLRETVPAFYENHDPPPVGFVAFGLGDYTSTTAALRIFDAPTATRLPRAFACFDNTIGGDDELHCDQAGELLAIDEFNRSHAQLKLGLINGLRHKRIFQSAWTEQVFVLHDFVHPRYADFTGSVAQVEVPETD